MKYKTKFTALVVLALMCSGEALAAGRYTPSADLTEMTDTKTGLIWRRCVEGMSWNGSTCSGTAGSYTHVQALLHANKESTASKPWRLPNIKELSSLVDRSKSKPSIDSAAFPATPSSLFWSSSPVIDAPNNTWIVNFNFGAPDSGVLRSGSNALRLVR